MGDFSSAAESMGRGLFWIFLLALLLYSSLIIAFIWTACYLLNLHPLLAVQHWIASL
jgi:hypothetical protein